MKTINRVIHLIFQATCIIHKLFISRNSFCTLFIIILTNKVKLTDSTLIQIWFVEKFYDNFFYKLQLRIDISENFINQHLDYGLYFLTVLLENIKKIL